MLASVAVAALGLAAVGVFSVMAHAASRRRHELGIRQALGARAHDIRQLVLRRSLGITAAGVAAGAIAALIALRALRSVLFGVEPTDPLTFVVRPFMTCAGVGICRAGATHHAPLRIVPSSCTRARRSGDRLPWLRLFAERVRMDAELTRSICEDPWILLPEAIMMRSMALRAAVVLCACSGDGTTPPEHLAPRTWQLVPGAPVAAPGERHDDIFFLDAQRSWIGTAVQGQIHRSVDGGATWETLVTGSPVLFRAIAFVTPELGWVGNLNHFSNPSADSVLWETRDGGRTWTDITARITGTKPAGICGLWVHDRNTIFGVGRFNGPAVFIRSTDGGGTWTSHDLHTIATSAVDVHFRDATNGFIAGGYSPTGSLDAAVRTVILRTLNGGATWQRVFSGSRSSTWAWKIHFATASVAYVAQDGHAEGILVKTVDGGETWTEISVGEPERWSQGIGFASADSGWIASDESLFGTTDGGRTWTRMSFGERINRFRFRADGDGFAVGAGVYRYARH